MHPLLESVRDTEEFRAYLEALRNLRAYEDEFGPGESYSEPTPQFLAFAEAADRLLRGDGLRAKDDRLVAAVLIGDRGILGF